ncbi:DUF3604 domain-containing protein [Robertkochia aurantiaca]|uniref:DUF3604 domain-containing protein n=1 Tax=Robertkochia aurantiaca TaxID=2873700 RepID=UPI001CC962A5|nr:DUF3604 domain-containing protein [Robertkochia sp. 3YJGBD-33]
MRTFVFLLITALIFSCKSDQKNTDAAETSVDSISVDVASNPLKDVYFGNLHVHTKWSFDAYINGAATDPDGAYRWAKGEQISGGGDGTPLKIKAPLDWYVVSDHSEFMGSLPLMEDETSPVSKHPLAADITGDDPAKSFEAYTEILDMISSGSNDSILGNPEFQKTIWSEICEIADRHYEPGNFTTFAGYEWTSNPDWRNLHRIIVFEDTKKVPAQPFSAIDSDVPEKLWEWMDNQREQGNELLAIPHNGNASDGLMFPLQESYGGSSLNAGYAETRMRNEPLYEITQIKGTSEVHPVLNPQDEFANFELWDYTLESKALAPKNKKGGYARDALLRGIELQKDQNANPFKMGFIGDSDTHNSAASIEEDNYTGKFGFENDPKHRLDGPPGVSEAGAKQVREFSSGGVGAIWAESNTREAIFAAMKRKETYATSGPRMKVRFFAGFNYDKQILNSENWLETAYSNGVPMGGDLSSEQGAQAPVLLIQAMKETDGANLDRIQVIKGWVENGSPQEKIFNVAWSGDRSLDDNGDLPEVGNSVNLETGEYTNDIGETELSVAWTDPDFDASQHAFYYVRVLQIPTPRWSTYDAIKLERPIPEGLPATIQERAWTSPIWYVPNGE